MSLIWPLIVHKQCSLFSNLKTTLWFLVDLCLDSVGFVEDQTSEASVIGHFVSTLLFGGQKKTDTVQL